MFTWEKFCSADLVNRLLVVCFLGALVLRGLNGWDIPSVWLQLSALLLILRAPVRQVLRASHLLGLLLLLSWLCWRDWSLGYEATAFKDGLKAALCLAGLLAVASLSSRQVIWPALGLLVPVCTIALLVYVGADELKRAWHDPLGVAGSNGLSTPSYRNKLSVALSLTCIWALCLSFSKVIWHRCMACFALVILTALLMVNGGIGTVIGVVAAAATMLFLLSAHLLLVMCLVGGIVTMCGIFALWLLRPEFLDVHMLLSGRDWILAGTWPHLLEHRWLGAGQGYFAKTVTPALIMPATITTGPIMHPHSLYVSFLLAYGMFGVLLLAGYAWHVGCMDLRASPAGKALVCGVVVFYLVYGLVDLRPLSPLPFAALLAAGYLLRSLVTRWRSIRFG